MARSDYEKLSAEERQNRVNARIAQSESNLFESRLTLAVETESQPA